MNPNDIHQKEQTTAPMTKPLATNDDFAHKDVPSLQHAVHNDMAGVDDTTRELAQRAFNFLNGPAAAPHAGVVPKGTVPKSDHRGEVKDPAHDHRLKQNKSEDDPGKEHEQEDEERDEREEQHDDPNKERLEHLRRMEEEQLQHKAAAPGVPKMPGSSSVVTVDPKGELGPSGDFSKPAGTKAPIPWDSARNMGRSVPKPQSFEQQVNELRNHPVHGPLFNRWFGPGMPTPETVSRARQKLQGLASASTYEQNEVQGLISKLAWLQVQLGSLNKDNG